MSVTDKAQFEVAVEAPYPQLFDETAEGRWFIAQAESGNVGVVWTNDDNGFGFIPTDVSVVPAAREAITAYATLSRVAQDNSATASRAFDAARKFALYRASDVQSGKLSGALETLADLNSATPVVAAADDLRPNLPNGKLDIMPGDTLAATVDDSGKVLALIFSDESDVYIRENGEWTPIADVGDERVDDREWIDVTLEFIDAYDSAVSVDDDVRVDEISEFRVNPQ